MMNADGPDCPYLAVFVWKSAGSTDVCSYFLQIQSLIQNDFSR